LIVDSDVETKAVEKTHGFVIVRKLQGHHFPLQPEIEKLVSLK
jgi:hypothetical protein